MTGHDGPLSLGGDSGVLELCELGQSAFPRPSSGARMVVEIQLLR